MYATKIVGPRWLLSGAIRVQNVPKLLAIMSNIWWIAVLDAWFKLSTLLLLSGMFEKQNICPTKVLVPHHPTLADQQKIVTNVGGVAGAFYDYPWI